MSKAIIIKGLDASGSPLGRITFEHEPQDLTSQIKWMGLIGGQTKCRFFLARYSGNVDQLSAYEGNVPLQFNNYGGSVGFIDLTAYQGTTIELQSHPWNIGDNRYFGLCFANALSDNGTTTITDEGIDIIPMSAENHNNAIHTISVYCDSVNSQDTLRTVQFTVPTVETGSVYLCFIENSEDTTFTGYLKTI